MTKFCECNSEWRLRPAWPVITRSDQLTLDETPVGSELCEFCFFAKWYNPQYENMMFDLKRMNQ